MTSNSDSDQAPAETPKQVETAQEHNGTTPVKQETEKTTFTDWASI